MQAASRTHDRSAANMHVIGQQPGGSFNARSDTVSLGAVITSLSSAADTLSQRVEQELIASTSSRDAELGCAEESAISAATMEARARRCCSSTDPAQLFDPGGLVLV